MAGLNGILELAKRSMNANQYGIGVTSHNIANASSPGYSRQRLDLAASLPEKTYFGYMGTGVDIQTVQRLRESYVDQQMYSVNANLGQSTQQEKVLRLTESFFQEPSDAGLNSMMQEFFNAFQSLSTHPEESSNRNALVQKTALMNDSFHRISQGISTMRTDAVNELDSKIGKVNELLKSISELNSTIAGSSARGLKPNDVMDQRDGKLSELSKLVNIRVNQNPDGQVTASIAGTMVVSNGSFTPLQSAITGNTVSITSGTAATPVLVNGGEIGGLINIYNNTLPQYLSKLDDVAESLISEVNAVHSAGYGIGTPPPIGTNFFTGSDSKTIDIDPAILQNTNTIAASKDGSPGNNEIALDIAQLQNKKMLNGNNNTVFQYYNGMVSGIGSDIESIGTDSESQQLVLDQLTTQQNSVAGVSLDEEMTNLIKFQHGFDASARIINTVKEMYDTIINMV